MADDKKKDLDDLYSILKDLPPEDLTLIRGGALVLKAKRDLKEAAQPG